MTMDLRRRFGPRTTRSEGDVALPIIWPGGPLPYPSDMGMELVDTGLVADVNGNKFVRAGTVLVPNGSGAWKVALVTADITGAAKVAIMSETLNMAGVASTFVAGFITGSFLDVRMPSLADNAVMGLAAADRDAVYAKGQNFHFASSYAV